MAFVYLNIFHLLLNNYGTMQFIRMIEKKSQASGDDMRTAKRTQ